MELVEGITCVYGPSATGKTKLCLFTAANADGKVIFIDTENTFSAERIREFNRNADLDRICLIRADSFMKQSRAIKQLVRLSHGNERVLDVEKHPEKGPFKKRFRIETGKVTFF